MSEADVNTYRLQLQQVEAALTTDPDNEELLQLKTDLEQVLNLTMEMLNDAMGGGGEEAGTSSAGGEEADKAEDDMEAAFNKPKKKSRWAEPAPILPIKPWQVGEVCQALYSGKYHSNSIHYGSLLTYHITGDGTYYDAKIEEITTDGEVSVKFKGFKGTFVTSLGLLKLPSSGTTTVHATSSAKNKKELLAHQKEQKKEKKKKHLENLKALEAEREKEKNKWSAFSAKAFGKKGFVKKSIFKTPESCDGRVGVGTCGMSGQEMTKFEAAKKYRKGH